MSLVFAKLSIGLVSKETTTGREGWVGGPPPAHYDLSLTEDGVAVPTLVVVQLGAAAGPTAFNPSPVALAGTFGESYLMANLEYLDVEIFRSEDAADTDLSQTLAITGVAATDVITTAAAHGLAVNDKVLINSLTGGAGLTAATVYFVKTVPSSTTLTLAATEGGATLDFTTTLTVGEMVCYPGILIVGVGPGVPTFTKRVFSPSRFVFFTEEIAGITNKLTGSPSVTITYPTRAVGKYSSRVIFKGQAEQD